MPFWLVEWHQKEAPAGILKSVDGSLYDGRDLKGKVFHWVIIDCLDSNQEGQKISHNAFDYRPEKLAEVFLESFLTVLDYLSSRSTIPEVRRAYTVKLETSDGLAIGSSEPGLIISATRQERAGEEVPVSHLNDDVNIQDTRALDPLQPVQSPTTSDSGTEWFDAVPEQARVPDQAANDFTSSTVVDKENLGDSLVPVAPPAPADSQGHIPFPSSPTGQRSSTGFSMPSGSGGQGSLQVFQPPLPPLKTGPFGLGGLNGATQPHIDDARPQSVVSHANAPGSAEDSLRNLIQAPEKKKNNSWVPSWFR
ncbi:transmembrane protein [Ceratobasidium sp. AG-Ba]|nr:transmembrane protein [Ceratobasidium sp. AG-Ba]